MITAYINCCNCAISTTGIADKSFVLALLMKIRSYIDKP